MSVHMNLEVKKDWLDALRSGNYKQGKTFLYRDNVFCCLGVLCEIQNENWRDFFQRMDTSVLPESFAAGLDETATSYLADMNDNGMTFKQIADTIEELY